VTVPPPLPARKKALWPKILLGALIGMSVATSLYLVAHPKSTLRMTTSPMSPAIMAGDCVIVDVFRKSPPPVSRGEIVVFTNDGISGIGEGLHVERLVGLPGETLRLVDGTLYVNGVPVTLKNRNGDIQYAPPVYTGSTSGHYLQNAAETLTVPEGCYFVLGDNTYHSLDSRYWGLVPATSLCGRVKWRYWPANRAGRVE
jgi:signal peptidase I